MRKSSIFGIMMAAGFCLTLPRAEAATKRKTASGTVPQCSDTAMKTAVFVDNIGWGTVKSQPLKMLTKSRDMESETYDIKSDVSGYIYHLEITQDYRSEACIVTSVTTAGDTASPPTAAK